MAEWTNNPTETGAYWMQVKGLTPDLAWLDNGNIWFPGPFSEGKRNRVAWYAERGAMFYGPLDQPPPCLAFRSNEKRLREALQEAIQELTVGVTKADHARWAEVRRRAEELLEELRSGE